MPYLNEEYYAYATQRLKRLGNSIFVRSKQILEFVGGSVYTGLPEIDTRLVKGNLLIEPSDNIIIIPNEEDLKRHGLCVVSERVDPTKGVYFKGQTKFYYLSAIDPSANAVRMPDGHYCEFDVLNKYIRLVGKSAGPLGSGNWIDLKPRTKDVSLEYDDVIDEFFSEYNEKTQLVETVKVPEIPIMISEENELICLPIGRDEPTIGFVGMKRTGKSFGLHGLADRAYWKGRKRIAILNDSLNECYCWSLPWRYANNIEEPPLAKELRKINEHTIPLPTVLLTPVTSTLNSIVLPKSGISFKISFPFRELLSGYNFYLKGRKEWKMVNTGRYFRTMINDLVKCKNIDEVEAVVKEKIPGKGDSGVRNKIISVMEDIFERGFLDVNSGVPSQWRVQLANGHSDTCSPIVACMLAGLVPVLQTRDIKDTDYFHQYVRYIANDVFKRQMNDEYFVKNNIQAWLFVDEIQRIASRDAPGYASEVLEKCVTEGGPSRLGFVYATQNYSKVTHRIRSNTKYLFVFRLSNQEEVRAIGDDFSLTRNEETKIKKLEKFEMIALTTEHFICYDSEGRRRESKQGEIFKGKGLPPLSMHKSPKTSEEQDEEKETDN